MLIRIRTVPYTDEFIDSWSEGWLTTTTHTNRRRTYFLDRTRTFYIDDSVSWTLGRVLLHIVPRYILRLVIAAVAILFLAVIPKYSSGKLRVIIGVVILLLVGGWTLYFRWEITEDARAGIVEDRKMREVRKLWPSGSLAAGEELGIYDDREWSSWVEG